MRNVRITSGTYGYKPDGARHVTPMTRANGPFVLDDAEAERIVALGVAEYAPELVPEMTAPPVATGEDDAGEEKTGIDKSEDENGLDGDGNGGAHLDADDLVDTMKLDALKRLAEDMGIDIAGARTKAEIAALIAAVPVEPGDDDEEAPPELVPEVPVS